MLASSSTTRMVPSGTALLAGRVGAGNAAQPPRRRLHRTLLRGAVDGDEPEHGAVAERPLDVVEGGPVEVAADVDAVAQAPLDARQRPPYVLAAAHRGGGPAGLPW